MVICGILSYGLLQSVRVNASEVNVILHVFIVSEGKCAIVVSEDERGHGAQRSEPEHTRDEQQGDLALLCAGHRSATHHIAQHTLRQCACGLDTHQPHSQHGKCWVKTLW